MSKKLSACRLCAAALWTAAAAVAQVMPIPFQNRLSDLDSGYLANREATAQIVFSGSVRFEQATWLRLHFEDTNLPAGSSLRLIALVDRDVQTLDAASLADYHDASAHLNGNEVRVELIAGPSTTGNRVRVDSVDVGDVLVMPETICGPTDDRVQSQDNRAARLGGGCTGWMMFSDLAMTAGHCTSGNTLLEFKVPDSTSGGQTVRSAVRDQYSYTFLQNLVGNVGADWGLGRVQKNSQTGMLPPQAYGVAPFVLGTVPASPSGQRNRVTGYGSSSIARLHLVQKTHVGPMVALSPGLGYQTDTTGGNSGSPVIHESTGDAIGIHTHGGCTSSGGNNWGTPINRPDIQAAVQNASKTPGSTRTFGQACPNNVNTAVLNFVGSPEIGRRVSVACSGLPSNQPGVLFLGVSDQTWLSTGLGLPFELTPAGMPGCRLYTSTEIDVAANTGPLGIAGISIPIDIPNLRVLIGKSAFTQFFMGSPGTNAAGLANTNAGEMKIGG